MIDGLQFRISKKYRDKILVNPKLNITQQIEKNTGTLRDYYEGNCGTIGIKVYPSLIRVNLSLHKFYNDINGNGDQNHDDFTLEMVNEAVRYLCELLEIVAIDTIIERIEFGVNLLVSFLPSSFLQSCLVVYKYNKPTVVRDHNSKGYYTEFHSGRHYLKIYDKGSQYGLHENLLRVELKYVTNEQTRKCGMNNLLDLSNIDNLLCCKRHLQAALRNLLITDSVKINKGLAQKDYTLLVEGVNPNYWEGFKSLDQELGSRTIEQRRRRMMKRMKKALGKYKLDKVQIELEQKLPLKYDELLGLDEAIVTLPKVA